MSRLDSKGDYKANPKVKVSQATVDKINKMGMKAAISHAGSGQADGEFVEAAKRFYGKRVTEATSSPKVTKSLGGAMVGPSKPNIVGSGPAKAPASGIAKFSTSLAAKKGTIKAAQKKSDKMKFGKNESAI